MPKCKSRISADDPGVKIDLAHHIARGRRVPEVVECVWAAGHEHHHSSETATWPNNPGSDVDLTQPETAEQPQLPARRG